MQVGALVCACACTCVHERVSLLLENTGISLCKCLDAVSAYVGSVGAGKNRLKGPRVYYQERFVAVQLIASSQLYDMMSSMQSQNVKPLLALDAEIMLRTWQSSPKDRY